jgi:hypothetical protein
MQSLAQVSLASAAANCDDVGERRRPAQNWILDPLQDGLFVIAAPLIVLAAALWAFAKFGAAEATSLIIVAHIIMTVAHHLPTFIRIYGDVDLFRRFKWSFVLGPVIPLTLSVVVLSYINAHDYPVESFLYLYIMLVLWDPWHFLRQHYGFMRIYDRPNAAPRKLAAHMDLLLCAAWFAYIMLASGAWLPELLRDLYVNTGITLLLAFSASAISVVANSMAWIAVAMTAAYGGYLYWCWRNGYFISGAKLALFFVTFGVMYLTYTPNTWMQSLAPGWTFKVGFAAVGIVHMTQYLAIVWRYNRSLAGSASRSRAGVFRRWHGSTSKWVTVCLGAGYVAICLAYGDLITTKQEGRWFLSVLLAVGFTSTLMHYYFDGFIWKVRHKQNREALAMTESRTPDPTKNPTMKSTGAISWWNTGAHMTPGRMFARQLLYFGVPMMALTIGAMTTWSAPAANYIAHMYRAQSLSQQGLQREAEQQARLAYADMNTQLPFAIKLAELAPTAAREADLAFLIYNQSLYQNIVMPQVAGQRPTQEEQRLHRENTRRAVGLLTSAIDRNESLAHPGREQLSLDEAKQVASSWSRL